MNRLRKSFWSILCCAVFSSGCVGKIPQTIIKADLAGGGVVCVAYHSKVVDGIVLETIKDGLSSHKIKYKVVLGNYTKKGKHWTEESWTAVLPEGQGIGCDAALFYVATWKWDFTPYMRYADIWITAPDSSTQMGRATYDARLAGVNPKKFINTRAKIMELVDGLFASHGE